MSGSRCAAEENSRVEGAGKGSLEPYRLWNGREEWLPLGWRRGLRKGQMREREAAAGSRRGPHGSSAGEVKREKKEERGEGRGVDPPERQSQKGKRTN